MKLQKEEEHNNMQVEKKNGFVRVEDSNYTVEIFETGSVYIVDNYNQMVVIPIEQLKEMISIAENAVEDTTEDIHANDDCDLIFL